MVRGRGSRADPPSTATIADKVDHERIAALLEVAPIVAFIKDELGRVVYMNKQIEHLFGFTVPESLGKTSFELLPARVAAPLREHDTMVMERGEAIEMVETVPTVDGVAHQWLTTRFPLRDSTGQFFVGAVAVDITLREQTAQELRKSRDAIVSEQRRMIEAVGELIDVLSSVTSRAQSIAATLRDNDRLSAELRELQRSAERASLLANHLLPHERERKDRS